MDLSETFARCFPGAGEGTSLGYNAAHEGAALWDRSRWSLRALPREAGLPFLHKFLTQDVATLAPGQGRYACCLSTKGGLKADLWLYVGAEQVWLLCAPEAEESLYSHLGRYARLSRVAFEDLADSHAALSVWGPQAAAGLKGLSQGLRAGPDLPSEGEVAWGSEGGAPFAIARNDLAGVPGYDLLLPAAQAQELVEALAAFGAQPLEGEALDSLRIEAGLPLYGVDLDEKTIPIEAGLEARAISYDKGCYTGQEVIARIKHRGKVNRHLRAFSFLERVDLPAPLFAGAKQVGSVTTLASSPRLGGLIGLGLIHRKHLEAELRAGSPEGPLVSLLKLPFAWAEGSFEVPAGDR